ncbi:winged helix-turn-helix transcriptional regulator [Spirosoma sp. BT702]|uniref:Winged helix-turn-helix transcriptional regulator n=1 Tax=Spirosoma profusum TaxID=2771354 RepID=A0A927GA80_9BACT|nr:winged helix-turn-helix domain-containing protein [Spirosoma profusum]MBD2705218.1 winged helix-turn-helix transcriptional regulator [Spirosoma profusum]
MGKIIVLFGIISIGLASGFATYVGGPTNSSTEQADFSRRVNLALRRTVDHLLRQAGDATSRIEPVSQQNANTFIVRLNRSFDYDQLPQTLKESFQQHNIRADYDVAVLDCADGQILLGYSILDVAKPNEIACVGRVRKKGCYNLQVTFYQPEPQNTTSTMSWMLVLGTLLTGMGYVVWQKTRRSSPPAPTTDTLPASPELIRIGQSAFDPATLTLQSGSNSQTLTYREAKLLRFFVSQPNQVIERDAILKAVWEDEGIIVGRSVDVFVSRLRKLFQDDPTVRLIAVHGVGYRLEIRTQDVSVS